MCVCVCVCEREREQFKSPFFSQRTLKILILDSFWDSCNDYQRGQQQLVTFTNNCPGSSRTVMSRNHWSWTIWPQQQDKWFNLLPQISPLLQHPYLSYRHSSWFGSQFNTNPKSKNLLKNAKLTKFCATMKKNSLWLLEGVAKKKWDDKERWEQKWVFDRQKIFWEYLSIMEIWKHVFLLLCILNKKSKFINISVWHVHWFSKLEPNLFLDGKVFRFLRWRIVNFSFFTCISFIIWLW